MAVTAFGTNDAQAVKLWSTVTMREALKATMMNKLMGSGKRAIIQRLTELEKSAGDTIKYDLLMQMTGSGVEGDNRMRDNEEPLVYYQDSVAIDQLRNAHAFRRMSQQRTLHDMRMDAKSNLADWFAGKFDSYGFRCLCGDTTFSFAGNTATVPDSDHYIISGDVATTGVITTDEQSLGNNDQIQLADLDYAKEAAKTLTPPIRPAQFEGSEYYVVILHTYSVTDIRLDVANSAYTDWPTIQMYANKRGLKNPIFTGALGVYNGMILMESTYLPSFTGAAAGTVRRNLFLGAQAGVFAMGSAYDGIEKERMGKDNLMSWYEQTDDFGNEKAISCGSIFGIKSTLFNSKDYGRIIITSYAASHNV
jgi:N4-gp56 family major capsid protein